MVKGRDQLVEKRLVVIAGALFEQQCPMWKPEHRLAAQRSGFRYPSDLTDAEWAIAAPMIPPARSAGRWRVVKVREALNGIFYVLSTGCQ